MDLKEIVTAWNLPSGANHVTVMYFDTTAFISAQRTALNTFWTSVKALQTNNCSYTIETSGRVIDDATGGLVGSWSDATARTGTGANGPPQVDDQAQGLVQWRTSTILNGRFLRGRTFVPCIAASQLSNGNLAAGSVTALQTAGNALVAAAAGFRVWQRPLKDPITHVITRAGGSASVDTATAWTEFAALRRRRN